jgi:hypothetical protein
MSELLGFVLAIVTSGGFSAVVTYFLTRRKFQAEVRNLDSDSELKDANEAATYAEAMRTLTTNNTELQQHNKALFTENVELQKLHANNELTIQSLGDRLADRDAQLKTCNRQLEILQNQDKQGEVTGALLAQQKIIVQIAEFYQQLINERERTMAAREQTFQELAKGLGTGPLPGLPQGHHQSRGEPATGAGRDDVPAKQPGTKKGNTAS